MPLTPQQSGRLVSAEQGVARGRPYTRIVWTREGTGIATVLVRRRRNGFLLAIPDESIAQDDLEAARADGHTAVLGPFRSVRALLASAAGSDDPLPPIEVFVLLIDVPATIGTELSLAREEEPDVELGFVGSDGESHWPPADVLISLSRAWIGEAPTVGRTSGYATADSAAEDGAPTAKRSLVGAPPAIAVPKSSTEALLAALLESSHTLQGTVQGLVGRVEGLETRGPAVAPRLGAAPKHAGGGPALASVGTQLLGGVSFAPASLGRGGLLPPPPRKLLEPAYVNRVGALGGGAEAAELEGLDGEELGFGETDALGSALGGPVEGQSDTEAALMRRLLVETTAAVAALTKRAMPDDMATLMGGSDGGGSGSMGGMLPGARGTAAMEIQRRFMEQNPRAIAAAIRANIAKACGTDPTSPQDALGY